MSICKTIWDTILTIGTVLLTNHGIGSIQRERDEKEIELNTLLIYNDMIYKIRAVQETFIPVRNKDGDIELFIYCPLLKYYYHGNINELIISIGNKFTIKELHVINWFYDSYNHYMDWTNKTIEESRKKCLSMTKNDLKIITKNESKAFFDIKHFYENVIYENVDLEAILKKLQKELKKIESKENIKENRIIGNYFPDVNLSIDKLTEKTKDVEEYNKLKVIEKYFAK